MESQLDKFFNDYELWELERELTAEKARIKASLEAEWRARYMRELSGFTPLVRALRVYIRSHSALDAYALVEKAIYAEANQNWPEKVSKGDLETDPVLKYVLSHTIPDKTSRHNTLFKNLGILLAQSDLTEDELEPLVSAIIKRCPGKSKGDLWSWIRASWRGQYVHYNRGELVRWLERNKGRLP